MSAVEPRWLLALAAVFAVLCLALACAVARADEPATDAPLPVDDPAAIERGYRFLVDKPYITPDFSQEIIRDVWQVWPEPARSQARTATAEERRKMTFARYGLTGRPDDPEKPLQYVVDQKGNWTLNCFGCHGGRVAGIDSPGVPNSRIALETLTEETRELKLTREVALSRFDLGLAVMPLGTTDGTTNAVMFGVALMAFRDKDLTFDSGAPAPPLNHHDMDAIPWWHFKHKSRLYVDSFAPKGHRGLMQFMLIRQNGPEKFREWAKDFRDVYAYIDAVRPPVYPAKIDRKAAARGKIAFERNCAECHGKYVTRAEADQRGLKTTVVEWPERIVPIDEVKTDRARYDSLSPPARQRYGDSWFNGYNDPPSLNDPSGYVAPPLEGVWASAPYFHNGAVPTVRQVLRPKERPVVWRRSDDGYDHAEVGLEAESLESMPTETKDASWLRRRHFDTRSPGKSAVGHDYGERLTDAELADVLEWLKAI